MLLYFYSIFSSRRLTAQYKNQVDFRFIQNSMFYSRRYLKSFPRSNGCATFSRLEHCNPLQNKKELPRPLVIVFGLSGMRRHPFLLDG